MAIFKAAATSINQIFFSPLTSLLPQAYLSSFLTENQSPKNSCPTIQNYYCFLFLFSVRWNSVIVAPVKCEVFPLQSCVPISHHSGQPNQDVIHFYSEIRRLGEWKRRSPGIAPVNPGWNCPLHENAISR